MVDATQNLVSKFVADIRASSKYRFICRETVKDVIIQELANHSRPKDALRIARERLHRLWAQFLGEPDYIKSTTELSVAFEAEDAAMIEGACSKILHSHASTRERMPEIEEFYRTIFSKTGIPSKISDLACAFGPFAFRRMGLPRSVKYHAYDINQRIVDLINVYFGLEDIEPLAAIRDVLCSTPGEQVDVAFLLKMYHCLEHRKRGAGWRVVEAAQANWIVVSFPTKNLRGQFADIVANYESHILSKSVSQAWQCFRLNFASETVLLIDKRSSYEQ